MPHMFTISPTENRNKYKMMDMSPQSQASNFSRKCVGAFRILNLHEPNFRDSRPVDGEPFPPTAQLKNKSSKTLSTS